jgi:endogenous inhibitor of DNA gyrase (YacG/DUF329 family)
MPSFHCPTCKTEFIEKLQNVWPFCSARCKEVDLGRWLRGDYAIPVVDPVEDDLVNDNKEDSITD